MKRLLILAGLATADLLFVTAGAAMAQPASYQEGYDKGYQAGLAAAANNQVAYDRGYQDRIRQEHEETAQAFDDGYDTASQQKAFDQSQAAQARRGAGS